MMLWIMRVRPLSDNLVQFYYECPIKTKNRFVSVLCRGNSKLFILI